jgi:hypothetical protein
LNRAAQEGSCSFPIELVKTLPGFHCEF